LTSQVSKFSQVLCSFVQLFACLLVTGLMCSTVRAELRVTHEDISNLQIRNAIDSNESLPAIAQLVQRLQANDPVDLQLRLLVLLGNNLIDNGLVEIAGRFIPSAINLANIQNQPIALAHLNVIRLGLLRDVIEVDSAISTSARSLMVQMYRDGDTAQLAQGLLGLARITNDARRSDLTIELISKLKTVYQSNALLADFEPHYWQLYASVLQHTGDTDAALEAQKNALDYALVKKQQLNASTHHFYLARLYAAKQDWPQAKIHYIESYLISKRLDDLLGMSAGAFALANVYKKSNLAVDDAEALEWAQIALPLQKKLGNRSLITALQILIGELQLKSRSLPQAKALYEKVKASTESTNRENYKDYLRFSADLAAAEGNFQRAYEQYAKFNETSELQASRAARSRVVSLRSLLAYTENERSLQAKQARETELLQIATSDRMKIVIAVLGCALLLALSASVVYFRRISGQYRKLSESDELTGAYSRRYLFQVGEELLKKDIALSQHSTAVIMMDVDHFKRVNDRWGHLVGDQVLQHCVIQIREVIRRSDAIIARYGGEEFCVLIPSVDRSDATTIAERIREQMANHPFVDGERTIPFTVSIGVAQVKPSSEVATGATTLTALIGLADERLYRAKSLGRNRVVAEEALAAE
jgi:diguanylate cyclase (GGDEF)-like protein